MTNNYRLLFVEDNKAKEIWPQTIANNFVKLTTISMQTSMTPESQILDLNDYSGKVIVISGRPQGNWIWSAKIEEIAGPLMSKLITDLITDVRTKTKPSYK
ncbi:hypothetical protein [Pelosinus baikalensis]|uniref:Uncharacterized protein n=1 Tax=Pelosinus baikalensis TaxID=2892015 RepID=A0ABS8I1R7_9FIRM|nr:hypothetical protein [Pelosinus baikalensis]MCC5468519.1 hypothetical protein [Pelosinus baikalensis]